MSNEIYSKIYILTGGIGTGKSSVAKFFEQLGAQIINADTLAREVVKKGLPAYRNILEKFGKDILLPDGEIDRKKLGSIVFSDQEKRKLLESIVHPEIQKKSKEEFIKAVEKNTKVIIYECPLFFETGLNKFGFKKIITVTSSHENILKRIIQRDKITEIEAQKRINSQLSTEQKISQSDIVIENNSSLEDLCKKITKIYNNLIAS